MGVLCNSQGGRGRACGGSIRGGGGGEGGFISPPNVYMTNTWLVPGSTGGYTAHWCQRAV